ncbi:MAG: PDZ domain-containing protein [Blastocatellia bacterium]|nr:PDZ domain-containing protein [Blastocatellia bacterium]
MRVHTVLCSLILFAISSSAQAAYHAGLTNASQVSQASEELTGQPVPKGWVWVTQTIDDPQLLEVGNIMTLDGEPMPSPRRLRVTLGLVIDDQGHVITRLIDVSPGKQPINITVRGSANVTAASFLGMDTVSGLCVLKADDPALKAAKFSSNIIFPPRLNIRLYGFHPKQASNLGMAMTSGYPRRNFYNGQIVKIDGNTRFSNIPVYQLASPQLTEVQDCSLILDKEESVFGLALYNIGGHGPQLVYPIQQLLSIAQPIIKSNQSLAYGWLGASGRDIQAPASNQSSDEYPGVRLVAVAPDSPADVAGVKAEDILLSVNDRRVETLSQLASLMQQMPAESEVKLRVKRGSEYMHLKARLAPAPALPEQQIVTFAQRLESMEETLKSMSPTDPNRQRQESKVGMMRNFLGAVAASPAPPEIRLRIFYGLEIMPLTGQLMKYFQVENGVLITNVLENNKSAARSGLLAGDVILKVGDSRINNLGELIAALDKSPAAELTISRRREQLQIAFQR